MIQLQNIRKVYRTSEVETSALANISVSVEEGEFVAVMGPSGCGKSTFLNIIGMLDWPTTGEYFFNGENIARYSESRLAGIRKQNIGFVFQSFNLIDELTVQENIELPLLYQRISKTERKKRLQEIMQRVGIGHRANHLPKQLSGGQQQRVAVARAVITEPKLILADEPTGNLDSRHGEEVMELLTSLNDEGTTIVMVTHSEPHSEYAQRVINFLDGHVLSENTKAFAGEAGCLKITC